MIWLMVFWVYAAPNSAVNWDGPWNFGMSRTLDTTFRDEASCRNAAITFIAKMHEGMLAPMRFRCIPIQGSLPKGAPR